MKLPAFQFYPGDWLKDPNLRRCSHAAKGVWMDILCLMFESEERGALVTAGRPWSDEEVAQAVGGDQTATLACIAELTLKGVANRRADGALYSKRMVRDEHKRKLCIEAGKRGGNPKLKATLKGGSKGQLKGEVKGGSNQNLTPSSSSSSSECTGRDIESARMSPNSWPELSAVLAKAFIVGVSEADARAFFHHYESTGWLDKHGKPVHNWESKLMLWRNEAQQQRFLVNGSRPDHREVKSGREFKENIKPKML